METHKENSFSASFYYKIYESLKYFYSKTGGKSEMFSISGNDF